MNFKGKACALNNSYPLRYFAYLWHSYISGEDCVSHVRMVASSSCPFELSPFNKLDRGKLVQCSNDSPGHLSNTQRHRITFENLFLDG